MASLLKRNMRLFGIPYQFLPSVDPRIPTISETVGRKFAENIVMDAPVITIMPGKPKYLPGAKDKQTMTHALIDAATDIMNPLQAVLKNQSNDESLKYYDFESSYREYIQYVNILCRTCASFLEIDEKIDGEYCYKYDYSKYKWNTDFENGNSSLEKIINNSRKKINITNVETEDKSLIGQAVDKVVDAAGNIIDKTKQILFETSDVIENVDDLLTNYNYVQFFIDATSIDESFTNDVTESKIKSALNTGSDLFKELAFVTNSAGIGNMNEEIADFAESTLKTATDTLFGGNTNLSGALSRVLNLADNVAKGENIIMPQVYQNSRYDKSYSFTVHLKSPYGTKFGYFMDICVPLMHLIALGLPKQTTANTYGSPFLVKAYCEGLFTCNMGMVTSMSITKGTNGSFSVDGLPTEVDVTVSITDLYSDLSMSPQSSPILFVNNSSLIEYLATTCGLSLITPNIQARLDMLTNALVNSFTDIGDNIMAGITETVDNYVKDFFNLQNW